MFRMIHRSSLVVAGLTACLVAFPQTPPSIAPQDRPQFEYHVDQVIPLEFLGETPALRDMPDFVPPAHVRRERKDREREEEERRTWNRSVDPTALPQGLDPALQTAHAIHSQEDRAVDANVDGFNTTGVYPADPILDVGPNHAILAVNNSASSLLRIFDKNLGTITASKQLSTLTGVVGGGDPVVNYDALADRWMISEFNATGANRFLIAVSTTSDPTGTYYAYSYTLTNFPDYPKYAVWSDCYIVTSNEGTNGVYALPRANMLAGTAGSIVRWSVAHYASIAFQACTPVTFDGGQAPPAGAPGMFMRMLDDSWTTSSGDVDQLELWKINYNAATPASSTITGPTTIPTTAFDTDLCGYTTLNCIPQPGTSTKMDPLREVLMNRIQYRNFGDHEAIVLNHSVDVDGTDRAAPRWYELRRTGGIANAWSIYQQGTFSPDATRRWMGSIAINANGDIGLMYNVSASASVFPGIRYTGRYANDPLGQMTFAETTIIAGGAFNGVNRWGDYNSLDVDPSDGTTFFGTACYIPASNSNSWRSRAFKFSFTPQNINLSPRVMLEGPFNSGTGLMNDGLRSASLIPSTQPFTVLGYTFTGSPGAGGAVAAGVFATTGNNAIVDWVIVELRNSAAPSNVVASCAALLQRDGDVVGLDGTSPVSIALAAGSYYVAIRHRNHLGAMTGTAIGLSASTVTVDLASPATSLYGTDPVSVVGGVNFLRTGDVTFNKQLAYTGSGNDRDPILVRVGSTTPNNTVAGYYVEDTNMDGVVSYTGSGNDRDQILVNVGSTTPNNTRSEQVP